MPSSCRSPPSTGADPTSTWPLSWPNWSRAKSVPFLPILRYKPTGLRKREVWERTWDLQRQEDAGEDVGDIPVPPKYATADFLKTDYWRLRGKLDVPKERWISYPHCSDRQRPDARRRLGRLESPAAGDGPGRLLRRPQTRRLGRQAAHAAPGGPRSTAAVDSPVASRDRQGVRRDGGQIVPDDAGTRRPRTRPDAGRHPQLDAACDDHPRRTRK